MNPFQLLTKLPSTLEIRLRGTSKTWPNASPRLTMIGSKIWLSYGMGAMECVLYERAETASELKDAVLRWAKHIARAEFLDVDSVFIDGSILRYDDI